MNEYYTTIKVRAKDHKKLKVLAAKRGVSMVDLFSEIIGGADTIRQSDGDCPPLEGCDLKSFPACRPASGTVLMPESLTAENGAKALLSGEFNEKEDRECPACLGMGLDEDDEECLECLGYGYETVEIDISWTNIKKIYAMAVKNLQVKL